jgi:hypothetical protein
LYRHFLYFSDLNYRLANDAKGKGGERQFNGLVDVYTKTMKTDGIQVKPIIWFWLLFGNFLQLLAFFSGSMQILFDNLWQKSLKQYTHRCVLTISVPLGVGQAPVENSRGSYKIKNVAQKKLDHLAPSDWYLTYKTKFEFIKHELTCSKTW